MEKGYIKLHRKFFSNALWKEARTYSDCEAWLDLIMSARYEATPHTESIGGREISYGRGQYPASIRYLAQRWNWSTRIVRNYLTLLKKRGMITIDNSQGLNIITLCNYEQYNSTVTVESTPEEPPVTNEIKPTQEMMEQPTNPPVTNRHTGVTKKKKEEESKETKKKEHSNECKKKEIHTPPQSGAVQNTEPFQATKPAPDTGTVQDTTPEQDTRSVPHTESVQDTTTVQETPMQETTPVQNPACVEKKPTEPATVIAEEATASSCAPSPEFLKFRQWIELHAPYCSQEQHMKQITPEELQRLKNHYTGREIAEAIEKIENRKDKRKNYANLYRTTLNWLKRDNGKRR